MNPDATPTRPSRKGWLRYSVLGAILLAMVLSTVVLGVQQKSDAKDPNAGWMGDHQKFIHSFNEAWQWLTKQPEYAGMSDQDKAEASRLVWQVAIKDMQTKIMADPDFPVFVQVPNMFTKYGQENPDNLYFEAPVMYGPDYRVWGTRGTTADLVLQLYNFDNITTVVSLDAGSLIVGPDGSFEVIVSPNPHSGNWMKSVPGITSFLVRYSYNDWSSESAGQIHIERIGSEGQSSGYLSCAEMSRRLAAAGDLVVYDVQTWLKYGRQVLALPANTLRAPRLTGAVGVAGQWTSSGHFDLADDEALVITRKPTDARYEGFELGNNFYYSMDYMNHQTSLTTAQSDLGSDGVYRYVVSKQDPGVPNWLDTEGHDTGHITLRWQGLGGPMPADAVSAKVVKLSDVLSEFPADVHIMTAAERAAQLYQRQLAIHMRYQC